MQAQVTGPAQRKLAPITTRTFGRFRLERRLAYGGMAEILLANDLRNGREVVLKRILPQYSSNPEFVQFFIHEGRLGQRLNHANLVATYEAGQVGETCYIALEYLRGATCIDLLRAAAKAGLELPLGAAVRIVADAARGLHHAHTAEDSTGKPLGVVHRDVTPHNLFLCRDGTTKVLDFGIAKAASQLHVTRTGTIKGKFSYLAPEQIRGESIDHRVDVFALGIVLHELLTLKPLFRGVNDADTLQRILTLDIPAPERVRHAVPPGLGAVALRALQRDRERRLPSAEALADSIEAVAEAECIDASPEVVAALLGELCPPPPDEMPSLEADRSLDFGPEPPSVRSRGSGVLGAPAMALGATGSLSNKPPSGALPLPLPPPPQVSPKMSLEARPQLLVLGEGDLDLDELPDLGPEDLQVSPSALVATPMKDVASTPIATELQAGDTQPNRPPQVTEDEPVTPAARPVALGRGSGATESLLAPLPRANRSTRWAAVIVAVAVLLVGALLIKRSLGGHPAPPAPPATSEVAPPPAAAPPKVAALPAVAPRPDPPRRMVVAEEGLLRLTTDGAASISVDGKAAHLSPDGALHLPPGRHKVVVTSAQLAAPRSFEVDLKGGETVARSIRPGHGRLRLAVTPWAEVQLDGRPVGTTPLQPLDLSEGPHTLQLKNGDLGANVKKRVVVFPDKETALRVDLFSR